MRQNSQLRVEQLRLVHGLSHAVARADGLQKICRAALDTLIQALEIRRASVLLLDTSGQMRFKAWEGLSDEYRRAVEGHSPWRPDSVNPRTIIVSDVAGDTSLGPLLPVIRQEGIRALAFIPLVYRERLLGKFMLYYDTPHHFSRDEVELAETIASHIAFVIERNRTERNLRLYSEIFARSSDGIGIIAPDGRYIEQNPAHAGLLGFSDSDLVDKTPAVHMGAEAFARVAAELKEQGRFRGELVCTGRDGRKVPIDISAFSVTNDAGEVVCHVGLKRDISDRKRTEQRLATQYAIADILANSSTLTEAAPRILESVCRVLDWEVGALWSLEPDGGVLRCIEVWHTERIEIPTFEAASRSRTYRKGLGLPGRVWETRKPAWIADAAGDPEFPRARIAQAEGLHGAFGFPILMAGEVLGVMEFYSRYVREPDKEILQMFASLGSQVGQFEARNRAKAALSTERALLEAVLRQMPEGVVIAMPPEGRIILGNEPAERILGHRLTPDIDVTALGEDLPIFRPGGGPSDPRDWALGRSLSQLEVVTGEEIEIRSPGGTRTVRVSSAPILDQEGRLAAGVATFSDVTDRKRYQESQKFLVNAGSVLAASLNYETTLAAVARLTVPTLADLCVVDLVDEDGQVRHVAQAAIAAKQDEAREGNVSTDGAHATAAVLSVVRSGKTAYYPDLQPCTPSLGHEQGYRAGGPMNEVAPTGAISGMTVPLRARGRILGTISLFYSESGRRYSPADVELAEDVARRAALALDNARLYREAQEASRIKDEFLATISHELRTPLNAIVGWSRLLRSRGLDAETASRALETIERNARAQTQIVDDLLDVSRIITGRLRLAVQPVELATTIESAIESVRLAAEAKNIGIDFQACQAVVSGDPDRLIQAIWNLLTNAIKFTPETGRVEVKLTCEGRNARVTVADTGKGISAEALPYIFERFRQADGSTARRHGGLGLGLAIARHMIELHGGTVLAESAGETKGALFTITLPLASRKNLGQPTGWSPGEFRMKKPFPELKDIRVLVVEDEPDSRDLISTALNQCGASVLAVESAEEALAAVTRSRWHVLVGDIGMPGVDGFELIRDIRVNHKIGPERLPAVAVTAYAREEDRARALLAGYQAHISKPLDVTQLAEVVAGLAAYAAKNAGA
jgi:PAS domain S-box-containing protein